MNSTRTYSVLMLTGLALVPVCDANAATPKYERVTTDQYTVHPGEVSAIRGADKVLPTSIEVKATVETKGEGTKTVSATCSLDGSRLACGGLGSTKVMWFGKVAAVEMTAINPNVLSLTTDPEVEVREYGCYTHWTQLWCVVEESDHERCDEACRAWGHGGGECSGGELFFGCDAIYCDCDDGFKAKSIPETGPIPSEPEPRP